MKNIAVHLKKTYPARSLVTKSLQLDIANIVFVPLKIKQSITKWLQVETDTRLPCKNNTFSLMSHITVEEKNQLKEFSIKSIKEKIYFTDGPTTVCPFRRKNIKSIKISVVYSRKKSMLKASIILKWTCKDHKQ